MNHAIERLKSDLEYFNHCSIVVKNHAKKEMAELEQAISALEKLENPEKLVEKYAKHITKHASFKNEYYVECFPISLEYSRSTLQALILEIKGEQP